MSRWRTWGEIPTFMKNDFTLKYYRHLSRKRTSMVFKRIFDVIMSAVLLVLLSPVILVLAVWMDDELFEKQLEMLEKACTSEAKDIKQIVASVVKTYHPDLEN